MLVVDRVTAFYGGVQALWGVSLRVEKGEIVTIVGSNGAGKTTTMKAVCGLVRVASGAIWFAGREMTRAAPHEIVAAGISHIAEGRRLFPRMTVRENLEMGSYPVRARGRRREALARVFDLFPVLAQRQRQLAGTLSGGEQQMVAIGRGLMSQPTLLILDEPSLGLAPLLVADLFRVVGEINRHGVTILLVEQNIKHALELSDRAYLFENGQVTLEGSGRDLLAHDHVRTSYLGL